MNPGDGTKTNGLQTWLLAIRPRTLPAAAAGVVMGGALAWHDGFFRLDAILACLSAALLLQIGSNLANDVFDFERGTDTPERLGPTRVTQAGLLRPSQVKFGMAVVFGLAALFGLYLAWLGGLPIIIVGVAAILSAIAYTGGPFPLGYYGLGDIFVFIFFGLASVAGTYYVQAGFRISPCRVVDGNSARIDHYSNSGGEQPARPGKRPQGWQAHAGGHFGRTQNQNPIRALHGDRLPRPPARSLAWHRAVGIHAGMAVIANRVPRCARDVDTKRSSAERSIGRDRSNGAGVQSVVLGWIALDKGILLTRRTPSTQRISYFFFVTFVPFVFR
jgi:hypothetical protein